MRLHLKTTRNSEAVPFSYPVNLTGALHKWLGTNEWHGRTSLYSFSWLRGSRYDKKRNCLYFPRGGSWFISAYEPEFIDALVQGVMRDPGIAFGMSVQEVRTEPAPQFRHTLMKRFQVASPVFVKRDDTFYFHHQPEADDLLTETMRTKMQRAGLPHDDKLRIAFDRTYSKPKIRGITHKGITNKGSMCPVIISGKPETLAFAWLTGVGNSTGIGFGALR